VHVRQWSPDSDGGALRARIARLDAAASPAAWRRSAFSVGQHATASAERLAAAPAARGFYPAGCNDASSRRTTASGSACQRAARAATELTAVPAIIAGCRTASTFTPT
jgi:hypothetical protein